MRQIHIKQDIIEEINYDGIRKNLNKYTRKAFFMISEMDCPKILDIGCGTGVPAIELARISNGKITGIDIDQGSLDLFREKIEKEDLKKRIRIIKCSLKEMNFTDECFDILWAEGSIAVIGFEEGLNKWRKFIKPKGYLGVHDDMGDLQKKLKLIHSGYRLIEYFILSNEVWWQEYYGPVEKKTGFLKEKFFGNPDVLKILEKEEEQIEHYRKNPEQYNSVFFVLQKE